MKEVASMFIIMHRYIISVILLAAIIDAAVIYEANLSEEHKCPKNEVWSWCGKRCEPTCKVPVPNEKTCPELVCSPLKAACRCKENLVRNEQKKCVELVKCPKRK